MLSKLNWEEAKEREKGGRVCKTKKEKVEREVRGKGWVGGRQNGVML